MIEKWKIGPHNVDILSIWFGTLLGDSQAEYRNGKIRFIIQQENINMKYLMWLHNYLVIRGYTRNIKPRIYKRIGREGRTTFNYRISSFNYTNLTWLYDAFYKNKEKRLPDDYILFQYLTPLALTIWIMNKGIRVTQGIQIKTNYENLERLVWILIKKYRLNCTEEQNIIYIYKDSIPLLTRILNDYLLQS